MVICYELWSNDDGFAEEGIGKLNLKTMSRSTGNAPYRSMTQIGH
jgi:hypothetical protein